MRDRQPPNAFVESSISPWPRKWLQRTPMMMAMMLSQNPARTISPILRRPVAFAFSIEAMSESLVTPYGSSSMMSFFGSEALSLALLVAVAVEQQGTLCFGTSKTLGLAYASVKVSGADKVCESLVCRIGVLAALHPLHRTAIDEHNGHLVYVLGIGEWELPAFYPALEIAVLIVCGLIHPLHYGVPLHIVLLESHKLLGIVAAHKSQCIAHVACLQKFLK